MSIMAVSIKGLLTSLSINNINSKPYYNNTQGIVILSILFFILSVIVLHVIILNVIILSATHRENVDRY
jgi:hypothetical protein